MSKDLNLLLAGFGGQGVLFAGKVIAYSGLLEGKEISWLPSYGPEMRGGTANCSVCLSEETIGSPLVVNPNLLLAMNGPSYHRFIQTVQTVSYTHLLQYWISCQKNFSGRACFRQDVWIKIQQDLYY